LTGVLNDLRLSPRISLSSTGSIVILSHTTSLDLLSSGHNPIFVNITPDSFAVNSLIDSFHARVKARAPVSDKPQGEIPGVDAEGVDNVTLLSDVHLLEDVINSP
jgi:hypothetical protein